MKQALIITSIIAIVAVSLSAGYYYAIALPAMNREQLEFNKMKHDEETKLKKEELKNECLKIKYSQSSTPNGVTPSYGGYVTDYAKRNMECSN